MRRILAPVFSALLTISIPAAAAAQPAAQAQPVSPAKLAEAHAIIDIMFPPAQRGEMADKLMTEISDQMRPPMPPSLAADPGVRTIMNDYMTRVEEQEKPLLRRRLPDILDASAIAYTHEFSLAELKDVHAFAETPSGRHYLSRSTALLADPAVVKVNKSLVAEARATAESILPEFKEKLIAYFNAHPDVAKKVADADKQ